MRKKLFLLAFFLFFSSCFQKQKSPIVDQDLEEEQTRASFFLDELQERFEENSMKGFEIYNLPQESKKLTERQKFFMDHPIVFTGDSLTSGIGSPENPYPRMLAEKLGVPVVNTAVAGWKSSDLLANLEARVLDFKPSLVAMTIGGNDLMALPISSNLQKDMMISLEKTKRNLEEILERVHEAYPEARIIFGMLDPGGDKLKSCSQVCPEADQMVELWYNSLSDFLKAKPKTHLVERVMEEIWDQPHLLHDSIHPNEEGYEKFVEKFLPVLRPILNLYSSH